MPKDVLVTSYQPDFVTSQEIRVLFALHVPTHEYSKGFSPVSRRIYVKQYERKHVLCIYVRVCTYERMHLCSVPCT